MLYFETMTKAVIWSLLLGMGWAMGVNAQAPEVVAAQRQIHRAEAHQQLDIYRATRMDYHSDRTVQPVNQRISPEWALSLVFQHCAPCHNPSGPGPFSLTNYEEVRRKAKTVQKAIEGGIMPPWTAVSEKGHFANAPKITKGEKEAIVSWLNQGAEAPREDMQAEIVDPETGRDVNDFILHEYTWDEPFTIYENGDLYQCFTLDLGLEEDIKVGMVEFISDNIAAVHHVTIFVSPRGYLNGQSQGMECHEGRLQEGWLTLDTWNKGNRPMRYTKGFAYDIPAGSSLLIQVHYAEGFKGHEELRTVRLYETKEPETRAVIWDINTNEELDVPADSIVTQSIERYIAEDFSLFGVMPHMHFMAKRAHAYAITKYGRKIEILQMDDWDYLWQNKFMFEHPIFIPGGSTVFFDVVYDNTVDNPTQPNDPPVDVGFGISADVEMLVFLLYGTPYQPGDEALNPVKVF